MPARSLKPTDAPHPTERFKGGLDGVADAGDVAIGRPACWVEQGLEGDAVGHPISCSDNVSASSSVTPTPRDQALQLGPEVAVRLPLGP